MVEEELADGVTLDAEVVETAGGEVDVVLAADLGGAMGLGASTPAVAEPRPSFCRLGASILPLELSPFSDWNFCMAETVFESHLPLGLPW